VRHLILYADRAAVFTKEPLLTIRVALQKVPYPTRVFTFGSPFNASIAWRCRDVGFAFHGDDDIAWALENMAVSHPENILRALSKEGRTATVITGISYQYHEALLASPAFQGSTT